MTTLKAPLISGFCEFLYASVGEDDSNGVPLTVLSTLARQDVDPWEEAAELSRLPRDTAIRKMAKILEARSRPSSAGLDPTATASRLIALLPRPAVPRLQPAAVSLRTSMLNPSPVVSRVLFFVIYMAMIVFGQWMMAGASAPSTMASSSHQTPAAQRVK